MANYPVLINSNSIFLCIFLLSTPTLQSVHLPNILRNDSGGIRRASNDYGNIVHQTPRAVLDPSSVNDIAQLIKSSYADSASSFTVAARGNGHSVRGQAMARNGVVVDMSALRRRGGHGRRRRRIRVFSSDSVLGFYADVGGEQLWIDVLREALKKGLSPAILPDYLYLTVGGTLSNAGIGGQAFAQGPLISNVHELDVITGKGEFITCSETKNRELFYGVLGGLGQFGIITRARIVLRPSPTRVKWVQLLYNDFSKFTRDQEFLIASGSPNYVEGFIVPKTSDPNTALAASFSCSPLYRCDYSFTWSTQSSGLSYIIELVKYYDNQTATTIDEEFKALLKALNFIPGFILNEDVPIFDFLNRVGDLDNPKPPPQSHPWLNLFLPKSRILDFNSQVLINIIPRFNVTNGLYIFYPLNKNKWDDRMSAMAPDEDVFYALGLLHTCKPNETAIFDELNDQILQVCRKSGIKVKQYLPHFKSKTDWVDHFGSKWDKFLARKNLFDPKMILSPGQGIFNY